MTAGLKVMSAILTAFPAGRGVGVALGAIIVATAIVTVLRRQEFSHGAPLGVFAALPKPATKSDLPKHFDRHGLAAGMAAYGSGLLHS